MNDKMDKILAEISAGELIDKITILEIKKDKIANKEKQESVNKELESLNITMKKYIPDQNKIMSFKNDLKKINLKLWDVEDQKRISEKNKQFDEKFINLARSVYKLNDQRAKLKLDINETLGSNIKEVKSYE